MLKRWIINIIREYLNDLSNQPKPVGIALFRTYTSCMGHGTSFCHPSSERVGGPGFNSLDFFEFYEQDITEKINDKIKIKGVWFLKSEVFFYFDPRLESYKDSMRTKFGNLEKFTDVHRLYDNGLNVSYGFCGSENHFHDKKLEKKIMKDMNV